MSSIISDAARTQMSSPASDVYDQRVKKIDTIVSHLTNTYYMLNKTSKSSAKKSSINKEKLAKRKFRRRRSTTTTITATGNLTDASESSFDSSLIDCFKSLATMKDVDVDVTTKTNKHRHSSKSLTASCHSNKCSMRKYRDFQSNKQIKRLQHSVRKHMNRECTTKRQNILLFDKTRLKQHKNPSYHSGLHKKRKDIEMPNCSYLSDVNDQSSVNEDDNDVDIEADDEQSDWPVNEPYLKLKKTNSDQTRVDDVDDCDYNMLLNEKTFARPQAFPVDSKISW
jgi:hypothetical protein